MSRGLRNILIGCLVVVMGVCVCVGAFWVVGEGVIQRLLKTAETVLQAPYGIATRPIPFNPLKDTLLPPVAGPYSRQLVASQGSGHTATYDVNGVWVQVHAAMYPSADDARAQVAAMVAQTENFSGTRTYLTGIATSFVRVYSSDGTARLAYNRDKYFFDVQANSHAALDTFMVSFPY
jgi:hypothetical protein